MFALLGLPNLKRKVFILRFNMQKQILNSRDVMKLLGVCENTLLKLERLGKITIDFRIGNRKRYYLENVMKSLVNLGYD
ncbi:MAG TPA: hypothetical protein DDY16_02720 [Tenacibaculum sp.]|nr:hypothetical protein [Tenacibaculum sp.]